MIPERDAPALLEHALTSVARSVADLHEPYEVIVVVNGAAEERYTALRERFARVRFDFHEQPLGFSRAVARGLSLATHAATLLLNNDMTLEKDAIPELLAARAPDVFAVGAQIFQESADGRREETGFTDWYVDGVGVHLYHASVEKVRGIVEHLCASGGAGLFRTEVLRRFAADSLAYDPFYWEDAEWGVRAWQEGWRVVFAPAARVRHVHRATTSRFYDHAELARIIERNRLLFDLRQGATPEPAARSMQRLCDLPYDSQRDLASPAVAAGVLRQRTVSRARAALHPPLLWLPEQPVVRLAARSYSYALKPRDRDRRCVVVVSPFAVFPPRHGGARRTAELLRALARDDDVVLVTDEADLYDAHSFACFDGLAGVYLVRRCERAPDGAHDGALDRRMLVHAHADLAKALDRAIADHAPDLVQVEHAELAGIVGRLGARAKVVLALHDACRGKDFSDAEAFARFQRDTLGRYDAVVVCSPEDAALVRHPAVRCVPNGSVVPVDDYVPSTGAEILFVGPFRYAPNAIGIAEFLREVYPRVRAAVPDAQLTILGGDEALRATRGDPAFDQPGVAVLGHRDDVPRLLQRSALSINPLTGIRGSAVKLVESLSAGRVCISTADGARGFRNDAFEALVTCETVATMAEPLIQLLRNRDERRAREKPARDKLQPYQWSACARRLREVHDEVLRERTRT